MKVEICYANKNYSGFSEIFEWDFPELPQKGDTIYPPDFYDKGINFTFEDESVGDEMNDYIHYKCKSFVYREDIPVLQLCFGNF